MYILISYIFLLNLIGLLLMSSDKKRAQKGKWRIPERRLWFVGILGGGIGLYWGMKTYHHKTKHISFKFGMPVIIVLNVITYGYVIYLLVKP
ncbi:DUF1294 domain-containing protein [Calidifontibacillus oryziterrae]|uniref:DUF1294 domain-containing protein n=1 Tax=Calidifontibacillus oryziterrae TaxID=1191699 RepID=UPI00030126BF|nr:DUF1294 domain-containing protein [Calidifontibacillus oryziterrae]